MIKTITVEGFKCFSSCTAMPMSHITACTGMNSVGKSTLIQALLLAWDGYCKYEHMLARPDDYDNRKILLNTSTLSLGSTPLIMPTSTMRIQADDSLFEFEAADDKLSLNMTAATNVYPSLFDSAPYYLNAERQGPRNYQTMRSHSDLHCGCHGEYTFDVIQKDPFAEVSHIRCFKSELGKSISDLIRQIGYWMSYIVNGVEVDFSSDINTQLAHMLVRQPDMDTPFGSPHNFGFGISYVLPIITTGLIAKDGAMFIVENPEAHLHPAGQSRIGEFLAQISCDNVQVVIETHSEHVLNGIRKYALKHRLEPEKICINYFSIDGEPKRHSVNRLPLNEKMDILSWPEGFFDQEMSDMKELRLLRGNPR